MNAKVSDRDLLPTGADTIAGQFMRRFWQPVFRSVDLPAGQARPVRILGEDVTLYRGEGGTAHAVGFRCAHRGVQLSTGFVEGDSIRCLYHGWRFDAQGACVERPGAGPTGNPTPIRGYPTQEYLGLVFVYFGEGEPPPPPRYPRLEGEGVRDVTIDVFPCNYFRAMENDAFHLTFTHRDLMQARGLTGIPQVWGEESDWGIACYERWPGRETIGVTHKGMPNVSYIIPVAIMAAKGTRHATLHISWRVPVDDQSHAQVRVNLTTVTGQEAEEWLARRPADFYDRSGIQRLGDEVLAGKLNLHTLQHTHIEAIQDYVAQVGMGPDETREQEHLSKSDATTVLLRRVIRRELQALADGRPLKAWALTDAIADPVALME
ncbi:MAG TPA: Rieske 2Fe-2S domain-containing protein [Ramlibacter sp.]|nr:Rieske 2Fe-2S domain-containing protein [Ramlibacter sp.]